MKPVKKIYANKSDSCATIVHKVISSGLDEFVLYLPKNAAIAENPKNFKLLKREANTVGKKLIIESVDEDILRIAAACGFEVADGIFNRASKAPVMDIMPAKSKLESISENDSEENTDADEEILEPDSQEEEETDRKKGTEEDYPSSDDAKIRSDKRLFKRAGLTFAFSVIIIAVGYVSFFILPTAQISIERKKTDWSFSGTVIASTKETAISGNNLTIPAQIFTVSKNGVYSFPASGSEIVEKKAVGTITIWNAYSSESQPLVKNTRFVTPDGKVYRLTSAVTIPGAKISEGKVQASSIESEVIADAAGDSYNVGSIQKLRIPGFQGSPKYDGFYGEFKTGASGGFVGEMKVPTKDDIKAAKEDVTAKMDAAVKSSIVMTIPPEFKIIENAITYSVTKDGVVSDPDDKGEFSYGVMMEAKVPAYKEDDLVVLMTEKFKENNSESYDLISKELSYVSDLSADLPAGKISIPLDFKGIWARSFDANVFKAEIIGSSEKSLKSAIFAIPGVLSAKADLWPFWVTSVPKNPEKIEIEVN
ncbi:MAG: hypothetical protein WC565_01120 [Parcubacteria group bacterium]